MSNTVQGRTWKIKKISKRSQQNLKNLKKNLKKQKHTFEERHMKRGNALCSPGQKKVGEIVRRNGTAGIFR